MRDTKWQSLQSGCRQRRSPRHWRRGRQRHPPNRSSAAVLACIAPASSSKSASRKTTNAAARPPGPTDRPPEHRQRRCRIARPRDAVQHEVSPLKARGDPNDKIIALNLTALQTACGICCVVGIVGNVRSPRAISAYGRQADLHGDNRPVQKLVCIRQRDAQRGRQSGEQRHLQQCDRKLHLLSIV